MVGFNPIAMITGIPFRPVEKATKSAWAKSNHINMLAASLLRDQVGWSISPTAISRNGVKILWSSVRSSAAGLTVKVDNKGYSVSGAEAARLRESVLDLITTR